MDEVLARVLAKAGIAKELTFAGILRVTNAYLREVDWGSSSDRSKSSTSSLPMRKRGVMPTLTSYRL